MRQESSNDFEYTHAVMPQTFRFRGVGGLATPPPTTPHDSRVAALPFISVRRRAGFSTAPGAATLGDRTLRCVRAGAHGRLSCSGDSRPCFQKNGIGGLKRDPAEARRWYEMSAKQGNLDAQFWLLGLDHPDPPGSDRVGHPGGFASTGIRVELYAADSRSRVVHRPGGLAACARASAEAEDHGRREQLRRTIPASGNLEFVTPSTRRRGSWKTENTRPRSERWWRRR